MRPGANIAMEKCKEVELARSVRLIRTGFSREEVGLIKLSLRSDAEAFPAKASPTNSAWCVSRTGLSRECGCRLQGRGVS